MEINEKIQKELWRLCQAYAFKYRELFDLPYALAEDIRGEAYVRCLAEAAKVDVKKSLAGLLSSIAWCCCGMTIRVLKTEKEKALWHARRVDGTTPERLERQAGFGDGGAAALEIRSFDEPATPMWIYAVRYEQSKLHGLERRIANGLMKTFVYEEVRKNLRIDKRRFWHNLKNLRMRFAQCFRAYHASREKIE